VVVEEEEESVTSAIRATVGAGVGVSVIRAVRVKVISVMVREDIAIRGYLIMVWVVCD
jgi:hypothetical protein